MKIFARSGLAAAPFASAWLPLAVAGDKGDHERARAALQAGNLAPAIKAPLAALAQAAAAGHQPPPIRTRW